MTTTTKFRMITLTERAPVKIAEEDWPLIAQTQCDSIVDDGKYLLMVRRHADGRHIVYGVLDGVSIATVVRRPKRRGYLVEKGQPIHQAVRQVASELGVPDLAADCMGALPAEEI